MQKIIFGTTVLMRLFAATSSVGQIMTHNDIAIDTGPLDGAIQNLSITQQDTNARNQVALPLALAAIDKNRNRVPMRGDSEIISIKQENKFFVDSNTNHESINYRHNIDISGASRVNKAGQILSNIKLVDNPTISASAIINNRATNDGDTANILNDSLAAGSLPGETPTYNLTVNGHGNTISNTVSGATAASSLTETVQSNNNNINMFLSGSGTQNAALRIDPASTTGGGSSMVNYVQASVGSNQSSNVTLISVSGDGAVLPSASATVSLSQTTLASSAMTNLTFTGSGFAPGTIVGSSTLLPDAGSASTYSPAPSILINQNSPNATLNANITAGSHGYTMLIKQ